MDHGDPPPPIPTLWKMNVDSTSAFFLEATYMNHKQLLPQQLLQVKGPEKSRDPLVFRDRACLAVVGCITSAWWSGRKLLPRAAISYGRSTECLSIIKYLQCKSTFKLMFLLHEMFKIHKSQTCGDWGKKGAGGCQRASSCCASGMSRVLPALVATLMSLCTRKVQVRVLAKPVQSGPELPLGE